jgi:hypothetical protein
MENLYASRYVDLGFIAFIKEGGLFIKMIIFFLKFIYKNDNIFLNI